MGPDNINPNEPNNHNHNHDNHDNQNQNQNQGNSGPFDDVPTPINDQSNQDRDATPENDLPVFNDPCRDRSSANPRVIQDSDPLIYQGAPTYKLPPKLDEDVEPKQELLGPNGEVIFSSVDAGNNTNNIGGQDRTTTTTAQQEAAANPSLSSVMSGPLKTIQYSRMHTRRDVVEELAKTIPLNEYGLPTYIYRPDLLNPTDFDHIPTHAEAMYLQQCLEAAYIEVLYNQGFPTFANGNPIWGPLEWESHDDFGLLCEFLDQEGVRSLHRFEGFDTTDLLDKFSLNYWATRAKAYDLYQAAHAARERQRRIVTTERNHYEIADKLLKKVTNRIKALTDDDIEAISPKEAADIMEKLVKIQRISIGLPATGSLDEARQGTRGVTSTEKTMRKIAEATSEDLSRTIVQADEVDILKDNPESLELAQELLLQVQKGQK